MNMFCLSRRTSRSGYAFTLMELLVVISIIAILIAMMLPVLGKTKESALQIKCLSNLHQMHTAVVNYAYDHDDYYPSLDATGGWYYRVAPGEKSSTLSRVLPETYGLTALLDQKGYMAADSGVWVCEAQPLEQQAYGNTYVYQGSWESQSSRKKVDEHMSQMNSDLNKPWLIYDNFSRKPYHSGWAKGKRDSSSGFTHRREDRWSPHPINRADKKPGETANKFAINILFKDGYAGLRYQD